MKIYNIDDNDRLLQSLIDNNTTWQAGITVKAHELRGVDKDKICNATRYLAKAFEEAGDNEFAIAGVKESKTGKTTLKLVQDYITKAEDLKQQKIEAEAARRSSVEKFIKDELSKLLTNSKFRKAALTLQEQADKINAAFKEAGGQDYLSYRKAILEELEDDPNRSLIYEALGA